MDKKKSLKYFSCFTGIGAAEIAFREVFPESICVGYSEIDSSAIKVYEKNFPGHKNFGDITKINGKELPSFDVIIGGSPCQGYSSMNAATRLEWDDPRSMLMLEYFRLLDECQPKYFILENVASMKKAVKDRITATLQVEPVFINSAFFTAQTRRRYYWTNFPLDSVENDLMNETLQDIMEAENSNLQETRMCIKKIPIQEVLPKTTHPYALRHLPHHHYDPRKDNKTGPVLTTLSTCSVIWDTCRFRQLTVNEFERLQGFPTGWTSNVNLTTTQRVKCVGNAFTVPVIIYILMHLRKEIERK